MTTILNGLLGGLVAAALTETLVRTFDAVSETRAGEKSDGDRTGTFRPRGTVVRLAYGSVSGGTLAALELYVLRTLAVPPELGEALLVSVGWSVLLSVAVVLRTRFVSEKRPDAPVGVLGRHLAFGVALGLWMRLTWIT